MSRSGIAESGRERKGLKRLGNSGVLRLTEPRSVRSLRPQFYLIFSKSLSEKSGEGSTGHWPVPSGDSLDGMGRTPQTNGNSALPGRRYSLPVGESPTGTGGSPVPPIFQTGSKE